MCPPYTLRFQLLGKIAMDSTKNYITTAAERGYFLRYKNSLMAAQNSVSSSLMLAAAEILHYNVT